MDGGHLRRPRLLVINFTSKTKKNIKKHLKVYNNMRKYTKIYKSPSLSATWPLSFYLRNFFRQQYPWEYPPLGTPQGA